MNGCQRIRAALEGRPPDAVPVMLHNFLMAAREAGVAMEQYRRDPRAIARCFIRAVETYGYDGVLVDVDTVTLAGALGAPVDFPRDAPARFAGARLSGLDEEIAPLDVGGHPRVQVWLEAVRLLREYFRDEIFVRGNCDQCAFSLAGMLRGPAAWMMDLMDPANHAAAHRLLAYCAAATQRFLELMAAAGAHMLSNGDSPAGPDVVSPRIYRGFAQPYEARAAARAHELGLPYVLHICGRTDAILPDMLATGADGLELDYKTDARRAHALMKDRAAFVGNIDPGGVLARGSPADVERETRRLVELFADTPRFILNAGCALPADTPPANLRAMLRAARLSSS
ncbi:MAG: uroporphyrinogen decarboxylase family protein [Bryobacteraceae bacterium]